MRKQQVMGEIDESLAASVGLEPSDLQTMYRLLAIAAYDERYVIPKAHGELAAELAEQQGVCGLDFEGGPGNCGAVAPKTNERFMLTKRLPILGQKDGPA
jgi:nitrate reductase beta subunit